MTVEISNENGSVYIPRAAENCVSATFAGVIVEFSNPGVGEAKKP